VRICWRGVTVAPRIDDRIVKRVCCILPSGGGVARHSWRDVRQRARTPLALRWRRMAWHRRGETAPRCATRGTWLVRWNADGTVPSVGCCVYSWPVISIRCCLRQCAAPIPASLPMQMPCIPGDATTHITCLYVFSAAHTHLRATRLRLLDGFLCINKKTFRDWFFLD